MREIAAKGARDVAEAAADVQHSAEDFEERMAMSPNPVHSMGREDVSAHGKDEVEGGKTYAEVLADVDKAVDSTVAAANGDDGELKAIAQSAMHAAGDVVHGAADTATAVKERVSQKAGEWRDMRRQAGDEVEQDLKERLQQVRR